MVASVCSSRHPSEPSPHEVALKTLSPQASAREVLNVLLDYVSRDPLVEKLLVNRAADLCFICDLRSDAYRGSATLYVSRGELFLNQPSLEDGDRDFVRVDERSLEGMTGCNWSRLPELVRRAVNDPNVRPRLDLLKRDDVDCPW